MGASKSVMEMCMMRASEQVPVSSARFANVAFSDGSLLHGFTQRIRKRQPFSSPRDVKRYFMTDIEAGQLCLISCLLGNNREIMFPKHGKVLQLTDFPTIATNYLNSLGFEPYICTSEDEARSILEEVSAKGMWPCYFFDSDTTGEKPCEEFHTDDEPVDLDRFEEIGIIKKSPFNDNYSLSRFIDIIENLRYSGSWAREDILEPLKELLPEFRHMETSRFLDSRM
jgi:FlaA1/EpsC-like NDP-sugar epimerase